MNDKRDKGGWPAWTGLAVLAAVLVFGLTAAPLTVVCMPADGRVIIELLGQDPCRHPCNHAAAADHSASDAFGECDPAASCHDLILDNPGLTHCGATLHGPLLPGADSHCVIPADAGCLLQACRPAGLFKLPREPERRDCESSMPVLLRI